MGSPVYSYSIAEHMQEPLVMMGNWRWGLVDSSGEARVKEMRAKLQMGIMRLCGKVRGGGRDGRECACCIYDQQQTRRHAGAGRSFRS